MATRKKAKPAGGRIEPIPWQEFALGFEIANKALTYFSRPAVQPPFMPPTAPEERPSPFLGMTTALRRFFGRDYPRLDSFLYRYQALMVLVEDGQVEQWVIAGDETHPARLHPALLLAAAEVRMTRNARFPSKRFAARVEEIIRTESDLPDAGAVASAAGEAATDQSSEGDTTERNAGETPGEEGAEGIAATGDAGSGSEVRDGSAPASPPPAP